ncbi:MAG: alpha/beta hydrolase family protein [Planctomycetota bacterium]
MRRNQGCRVWILSGMCGMVFSLCSGLMAQQARQQPVPEKVLPLPGEVFEAGGRQAFVIAGSPGLPRSGKAWVWYAPTLPNLPGVEERWMFERFKAAGIAVAGIDAGESYGSPQGNTVYSAFYEAMQARGFSAKPLLLGRSRGGLMTLSWAAEHPQCVSGFAGIYPVCNLSSYPGLERAAGAFELTAARLQERLREFNPVDRLEPLVKARVPLFAIHGDVDRLVPLEANSGLVKKRCEELGGGMELVIPPGQGHSMWPGFFQSEELVAFVLRHADPTP